MTGSEQGKDTTASPHSMTGETAMTSTVAPTSAGRIAPDLERLHRIRDGVRAVLILGVAASVAANVLHAEPTIVGRAIGAWSPLALLLTVELISRVPVHRPSLSALRMTATAVIAGIAAWVSYWHMVSVAARNGESVTSAHLLPLSVDGLVVVASISLVEIAARLTPPATRPDTEQDQGDEDGDQEKTEQDEKREQDRPDEDQREDTARKPRKPVSAAATVARLRKQHPAWTVKQIAERAGVSERTARRHLNTTPAVTPAAPLAVPDADRGDIAA
jgi:Protein of unknown function (DUF2637)/HTH domain